MQSNPRLDAALAYAARGWFVFPCQEGKKVPATKNGWLDATTDAEAIKAWWSSNPGYNVAIATGPSNLCVVDIDPGGLDGWDELVQDTPGLAKAEYAFPRVDTPRGGFHYYMQGEGPTSASKLAVGVDTRGKGGYVLAPPSYVDDGKSKGTYSGEPHLEDIPPVYGPLISRLGKKEPEVERPVTPPEQVRWDEPGALIRATALLERYVTEGNVAVQGAGGDQTTYEVACKVLELGITPETAHKLLDDIWNPHCNPPWDSADLLDKIKNAWRYGQETKGGKAELPVAEQFAHLLPTPTPDADPRGEPPPLMERYQPISLLDARKNLPPLEWLIEGVMPKQGLGVLYAAPASHKTFITLDLSLSVVTGLGVNWWKERQEPGDVVYMIGEGAHAFKGQRTEAWLSKNLLPGLEDHLNRFFVLGSVVPYYRDDQWKALKDWLRYYDIAPKLVVVDTHSRAMLGMNENDNSDTARALAVAEEFSKEMGCFVLIVHHTGKDEDRGARGSSAMLGNVDAMYELARLPGDDRETTLRVKKLKDGEEPKQPLFFRGHPYGESLAFHRDWDYVEEDKRNKKLPKEESYPPYLDPVAIARAFGGARSMQQAHLAETLAQRFGVQKSTVSFGLTQAKKGRLKAWFIDEMWKLPEGFEIPDEEEF